MTRTISQIRATEAALGKLGARDISWRPLPSPAHTAGGTGHGALRRPRSAV